VIYLDTSALVKLVALEAESAALRRFVAKADPSSLVTSALSRAELLRAAHRHGGQAVPKAREVLDAVATITITEALLDSAGSLAPATLRTLDAIHLTTALELGADLVALIAYDVRLLAAARDAGIPTLTPR
jgi:predicted nucleic acid-binding protein